MQESSGDTSLVFKAVCVELEQSLTELSKTIIQARIQRQNKINSKKETH